MAATAEDRRKSDAATLRRGAIATAGISSAAVGIGYAAQSPYVKRKFDEMAKVRMGGTPDDMGGSTADKLERLHRRAKGTPEGDVALRKLTAMRIREGKTFTGRAKKIIGKLTTLSAREQLDLIKFDTKQDRKYRPVAGTVGALTLPGIPGAIVGMGFKKAVTGGSNSPIATDKPVLQSLRKSASKAGVKIHQSTNPNAPAFFWRHGGQSSMLGKLSRAQVMQATGSSAATGIGIGKNIRSSLRPGVLAHEIGHATQHRLLNNTATHVIGKYTPQVGSLYAGITSNEKRAKTAVAASTLAAAPMLASEISASIKGSKLLRGAGVKGIRRLSPAIGLPTYAALTALPYLTYKTKKMIGGYKKETQMGAREQLIELIELGLPLNLSRLDKKSRKRVIRESILRARGLPMGMPPMDTHLGARDHLNEIIELKAVDLGYTYGSEGMAAPCAENYATKKHYPSLYISDREDEIDLPLSGTAKVRFKTRSKTSRQDEGGKKRHSADIEIQSIDVIEADEAPSKKLKEGAPAKLNTYSARDQLTEIIELARGDQAKTFPFAWDEDLAKKGKGQSKVARLLLRARAAERDPAARGLARLGDAIIRRLPTKLSSRDQLNEIIQFGEGEAVGQGISSALKKISALNKSRGAGKVLKRKFYPKQWDRIGQIKPSTQSLSSRLDGIISLAADPRPRNRLGMFDGGDEGPDPNAIGEVYKGRTIGQNLVGGAVAGVGAAASGTAVKALFAKLKKAKV